MRLKAVCRRESVTAPENALLLTEGGLVKNSGVVLGSADGLQRSFIKHGTSHIVFVGDCSWCDYVNFGARNNPHTLGAHRSRLDVEFECRTDTKKYNSTAPNGTHNSQSQRRHLDDGSRSDLFKHCTQSS